MGREKKYTNVYKEMISKEIIVVLFWKEYEQ